MVDIPRQVLEALERHKADCPPIDGDYVFRTAEGTPIDPDNWYKRDFPAICKRAGQAAKKRFAKSGQMLSGGNGGPDGLASIFTRNGT